MPDEPVAPGRADRIVALDGLRGVAIALVVTNHLVGFVQGWIGVDLFFALSGYLITSILLRERARTHFWKKFYIRRAARIAPGFLLLLLLATVFTPRPWWPTLWPYLAFFCANVGCYKYQSMMVPTGLTVLWSLSVEEHFYLVWPLQVRKLSLRTLAVILLTISLVEPVLRTIFILKGAGWMTTYVLTPFRLDGLTAGALLAIAMQSAVARVKLQVWVPRLLICSSLLLAACFPYLSLTGNPLLCNSIGISLLGAVSVLLMAHLLFWPDDMLSRGLSNRFLVFLGRISYGLYLLHGIFALLLIRLGNARGYMHNERLSAASLPLSIFAAWLSFRYYESYFLRLGKRKVNELSEEEEVMSVSQPLARDAAS